MEIVSKYKKPIIISTIIVVSGVTAFLIYFNLILFRITSSSPAQNGKVNLGQSVVIFNFTKDIDLVDTKTQISSSSNIVISTEVNKKKLIIYVKNIKDQEKYTIEIKNIRSKSGDIIKSASLNFIGAYLKVNELSKETFEVTSKQTDSSPIPGASDPVTKILPKMTPEYSLKYIIYSDPSQKGKNVKIQAVLFIPDYDSNNTAMIKDYKNQALNYLRSNNINPNDYVIDWNPASAANL